MRFLQKSKKNKSIVILSDLHLSAGTYHEGRHNCLEDFHFDRELVEFLEYYSSGEYQNRDVELIINGDFLDFLAVPYVEYFDDEFWSEKASLAKLDLILNAHKEVFNALNKFVKNKKNNFKYILGNHDAELTLSKVKDKFLSIFEEDVLERVEVIVDNRVEYRPVHGIVIKHGHEYELPHDYSPTEIVGKDKNGEEFIIPPWGSYYVTRVINRFKPERNYINAVRPIKKFLINGLIYDSLFTIRFILATCVYFIMVRFLVLLKEAERPNRLWGMIKEDLDIFRDYEEITEEYLLNNDDVKCLIVGHTHAPILRSFLGEKTFINTGTWTNMYNLDFGHSFKGSLLTYAQIDIFEKGKDKTESFEANLNVWKGLTQQPFVEFR